MTTPGSLMDRVDRAITVACDDHSTPHWAPEARAAIREVAAWFRTIAPKGSEAWRMAAEVLEQEANQ